MKNKRNALFYFCSFIYLFIYVFSKAAMDWKIWNIINVIKVPSFVSHLSIVIALSRVLSDAVAFIESCAVFACDLRQCQLAPVI